MPTLLARHARFLVTMDDARREIPDGALFVRDGLIEAVGSTADLPDTADEILDLRGHVVLPGLINSHHHLYQTLTRAVPGAQDAELFNWLTHLYGLWQRLTPEMVYVSALTGLAELILSGCTTSSDHLYLFPNGARLDDEIQAAAEIGIRFHAARGSMSVGRSAGGLPPDSVVEKEADIVRDTRRLIETYHDPRRYAMLRIAVAPCSPFSVSQGLMRDSAALARSYGVRLHTHLAENIKDIDYTREHFHQTPAEYAESVDWLGSDVWHAHCVQLDGAGIAQFARTGTGVAHCPGSNFRLASGIAPIKAMRAAGVRIGLGVDGSASNDAGHLLGEARLAMLAQRAGGDPAALTARQALELATRGGASVLGRDDVGHLAPGMAADFVAINTDTLAFAGGLHDPVAALIFCAPQTVDYSVINGRLVVRNGQLTTLDLQPHVERHNRLARQLVDG
ncbi:MAG: 8-oxoguanine deaminase [Aggregatilineales bacterium]